MLVALLYEMERAQWLDRRALRARQFAQLAVLARHAVANVPHYRGLDASLAHPQRFAAWPILHKSDLVGREAALAAAGYPKEHGRIVESATTGSTGEPVRLRFTELAASVTHAVVLRNLLWHRLDFGAKLALINPRLPEQRHDSWGAPAASVFATGPSATLDIGTDVDRQLDWLVAESPAYLQSRPSNLRALLLRSRSRGVRPAGLRAVILQSEAMGDGLRELAAQTWGVRLLDTYSCGELGAIALQCPEGEQYHVQSESAYVEVLREDGTACAAGEVGRVVATSLHNFAMPLIRYQLGDYAEAGEPCACGRGLPVLRRIVGRVRNMARDPTGRTFWPSFHAPLWLEVAPFRQIQLVQPSVEAIEVRYVLERALSAAEEEAMRARLRTALGYDFRFSFVREASIGRTAYEKFEDFVSLID